MQEPQILVGAIGAGLTVIAAAFVWWDHRKPTRWVDLRDGHRRTELAQILVIVGALMGLAALLIWPAQV